ncbi:MAG: 4Fe-4S dicluster domain-containing protein [bacterium]|nr:4Fe-4S dicluster domain-containing protein [bacterium]
MTAVLKLKNRQFVNRVESHSGTKVSSCVQCHKCSTGCPVGQEMDLYTSQIMRLINLGEEQEVLRSNSIWLCASCEACTTRCPMGIDIAAVMDTLRIMSVKKKEAKAGGRVQQFNSTFLSNVKTFGRIYELGMMAILKLRTRDLFSDMEKAPKMFAKGKLSLKPHFSKRKKEIKEIFKRAKGEENKR